MHVVVLRRGAQLRARGGGAHADALSLCSRKLVQRKQKRLGGAQRAGPPPARQLQGLEGALVRAQEGHDAHRGPADHRVVRVVPPARRAVSRFAAAGGGLSEPRSRVALAPHSEVEESVRAARGFRFFHALGDVGDAAALLEVGGALHVYHKVSEARLRGRGGRRAVGRARPEAQKAWGGAGRSGEARGPRRGGR